MEVQTNSAEYIKPVQNDLCDRLYFYVETMSKPWVSPLKFSMHVGLMCSQNNVTKEIDICSFIAAIHLNYVSVILPTSTNHSFFLWKTRLRSLCLYNALIFAIW